MQAARKFDADLQAASGFDVAARSTPAWQHAGAPVPVGESPALELQRRLESAVLRGFYAEPEPVRWGLRQRVAFIAAAATGSWLLVFGIGWQLLG